MSTDVKRDAKERRNEPFVVREFRREDAAGLAKMLNESEEGWPGGLTGGIPFTPERALERIERDRSFAHLMVVDRDGEIVGYCGVTKHWRDKEAAYVDFLNVIPKYHGKGLGRRLLLRSVEEVVKRDLKRLDLHTWSGNMKAVPLYKKTGFFWVPETSVYMQNYLPMIFKYPIAKEFFSKHPDWYHSYKRALELEEDEYELKGMKVFPYLWEEGGDRLKVLIDKESRDITGLETNELQIRCWVEAQEAPAGVPLRILWSVSNKTDRRVSCSLLVEPDEGIELLRQPPQSFTVEPKGRRRFEGRIVVDPAIEAREWDKASNKVKTNLIIDGTLVPLATGLRVMQPVEVSFDPEDMVGPPGCEETLMVNVRNRLRVNVEGEIRAIAPKGVSVAPASVRFRAIPKGYAGGKFQIGVAQGLGTRALPMTFQASINLVDGKVVSAKPEVYFIKCIDGGGVVTTLEDDKELVLASQALTATLSLRGGELSVKDNISDVELCHGFEDSLGPPFWPSEFMQTKYKHEMEQAEGTVKAKLFADSQIYPGIRLAKLITLSGGSPIIKVEYSIINNSSAKYDLKLQIRNYSALPDAAVIIPLKEGLVRGRDVREDFPQWERDAPNKPDQLIERWGCFQQAENHLATGLMWSGDDIEENSFGGNKMPELTIRVPDIAPQSTKALSPMYLYCGYGDWKTVREYYRRLIEGRMREETRYDKLRTRPPLEAIVSPSPVGLRIPGKARAIMRIRSSRLKPLSGKVKVVSPTGWDAALDDDSFEGLTRSKDWRSALSIRSPENSPPGFYAGGIVLELPEMDYRFPLDILIFGQKAEVAVRPAREKGMKVFTVDNGRYLFKICPAYAGAMYSAVEKGTGKEQLLSSFPTPKPFIFVNPWHGGVRTFVMKEHFPGKSHEEKWIGRRAQVGNWEGVAVSAKFTDLNEDLKGLAVETSFLTMPGSDVVAIMNEWRNNTTSSMNFESANVAFLQLGGFIGKYTSTVPRGGDEEFLRRGTEYSSFLSTRQGYAVVSNQETGDSACLVMTHDERTTLEILDMAAKYGAHFISGTDVHLKPRETMRTVNYLAFAKTREDALKYRILRNYRLWED